MAVLRDIVARIGLDVDDRGFKKADKSIQGTAASLANLGRAIATSGFVLGLLKVTTLASDAAETLNVLNASFAENSQAVLDWAQATAGPIGRSEFQLREMAATLGAVLNPLMERNAKVAADMSTSMAQLAVDLGSFFNATDEVALNALRAGLTGEAEQLKKFGIVMNEATLGAFALSTGVNKSIKSMSIAEKTQLRYNFIMDQTALAQGDAEKTSAGFANVTKALGSSLRDLAIRVGLVLLPGVEKIVGVVTRATRGFTEWLKGTELIKAGLIVLGAVAAKVAIGLIIAFAPVLLPLLKFAAIIAIAALLLDDFLVFMKGGDSVIGRFIDSIFGPGSATEAVRNLKEAWEGMKLFWEKEVIPGLKSLRFAFREAIKAIKGWFADLFDSLGTWVIENQKKLMAFSKAITGTFDKVTGFLGIDFRLGDVEKDLKNIVDAKGKKEDAAAAKRRAEEDRIANKRFTKSEIRAKRLAATQQEGVDKAAAASAKREAAAKKIQDRRDLIASKRRRVLDQTENKKDVAFAKSQGFSVPGVSVPRRNRGGGGGTVINNNTTVNANNTTARTAGMVADKTARKVGSVTRKTQAALQQRAE